jgi:phosphate transport system substrate-binding protein
LADSIHARARAIWTLALLNRQLCLIPIFMSAMAMLSGCDIASSTGSRDQIRVVGSSTVYPFAVSVAEHFIDKTPGMKSPVIEQNGTGAGAKIFCGGIGARFPDALNASRRLKRSEFDLCARNGVTRIGEIQIGLDGMAFGEARPGPALALSTVAIYRALAATPFGTPQTARLWRDVDRTLPAIPIKIYGPPASSGTRDALAELILTRGCNSDPAMARLITADPARHRKLCTTVREDGVYVEAGENDALIVQKLYTDPDAIGIFGYSFIAENADRLSANRVNGVMPTTQTIGDFSYPGARPLYIYVKLAHLSAIRGLRDYVAEFANGWGPDGYLARRGMVTAPDTVRAAGVAQIIRMTPLDRSGLQ